MADDDTPWTGATGRFPRGMLNADDEGEIQIAIGSRDGVVVMDFGKPVRWLGWPPEMARQVAASLIAQADSIDPPG